jgi:hypothetical protein
MKWLTGILVASALTVGVSLPAFSQTMTTGTLSGQDITGQVESIDGSVIKVKTTAGDTKVYQVESAVISGLSLAAGSNVVIDNSRLQSGVITYLSPYNASVALDGSSDEKDYFLTRVSRRYVSLGDRVVITPDLRLIREDLYQLTAADLRLKSVSVASSSSSSGSSSSYSSNSRTVSQPLNTGGGTVVAEPAPPIEAEAPVRGLW